MRHSYLRTNLPGLTAVAILGLACKTMPGAVAIDDSDLAKLSAAERASTEPSERAVEVAEGDVEALKQAKADTSKFVDVVKSEVASAKAEVDAKNQAIELADRTGKQKPDDAQIALQRATARVEAAEAKLAYARALDDLRGAERHEAEAQVRSAKAKLELAEFQALERADHAGRYDRARFVSADEDAHRALLDARRETELRKVDVTARQQIWAELKKRFLGAAGQNGEIAIDTPPPVEPKRHQLD